MFKKYTIVWAGSRNRIIFSENIKKIHYWMANNLRGSDNSFIKVELALTDK